MIGPIICVLVTGAVAFGVIAACQSFINRKQVETLPARVLRAIRYLDGRGTALQIAAVTGWSHGPSPTTDVKAALETLVSEGSVRWEWDGPTGGSRHPRKIYILNGP